MIQEAIQKLVKGESLNESEMMSAVEKIADGKATGAQIGAFLASLRMKGETVEEIAGAARVMRARCRPIPLKRDNDSVLVDTCGTGGDGAGSFNVSTTAAFVVAGAGLKTAKHGNRAISSRCGSADVLEELGVNLDLTPDQVGECIDKLDIGFLFAPMLHPAMGHVAGPRREMGMRTVFNVLGPLTNPAGADVQVLGVYSPVLTEKIAGVLARLGRRSAFVVHGMDGCDEISITGPTRVTRLHKGELSTFTVTPEGAGLTVGRAEDIKGGSAPTNAAITLSVLKGEKGACRDMTLINAGAAITAAGLTSDLKSGVSLAAETIDSGAALEKLNILIKLSRSLSASNAAA